MKFTYNPRILKHLGTELITSDEIAITELIKNSYDAKASRVNIHFLDSLETLDKAKLVHEIPDDLLAIIQEKGTSGVILIEDDGVGMGETDLKKGFFEIGTQLKVKQREELKKSESNLKSDSSLILGDKGIGRLSAQRLAPILFVETTSSEENYAMLVKIEWENFINDESKDAPEWRFEKQKGKESYTRLWFLGTLNSPLNFKRYVEEKDLLQTDIFGNPGKSIEKQLLIASELQSSLGFLYSPFLDKKSDIDLKIFLNGRQAKIDFSFDVLKIAESIHSFSSRIINDDNGNAVDLDINLQMEIRPWFIERIHQNEIGKVLYQDWKRTPLDYLKLQEKYKEHYSKSLKETLRLSELIRQKKWPIEYLNLILSIAPLEGKVFSFKRDNLLMKMAIDSAIENSYVSRQTDLKEDTRSFLDVHNGIKLYRNQFRIGTIGNKDNDWLKLQQKRTSGQQFYRFELGNVVGYIRINDPYQAFIYETSSREHLTDNLYVKVLQDLLDYIFDAFSPRFTKRAVEITKDILDLEELIPKNAADDIKSEVKKSQEILMAARQNLTAIQKAFQVINENLDLDTDAKRNTIRTVLSGLKTVADSFQSNIDDTNRTFASANKLIKVAESEQKRIEVEAYNNYKLMANGLVTEVITHELHSLLSNEAIVEENEHHFEAIKAALFEVKKYEINKFHLEPVHEQVLTSNLKMKDLNRFYAFLEKTFIYRGNSHDFEQVVIAQYLNDLEQRFASRLNKHKIKFDYSLVKNTWFMPKGSLMHIVYNLMDNSIYWIQERQKRELYDKYYNSDQPDRIVIRDVNSSTLQFHDTGTGVLPKYEHTLFHPLESGKENGRGMGLYIVRNFLRSFGGDIELLPNRNQYGNRFIFEIRINESMNDSNME